MNLREWASNSADFLEMLPEKDRAKGSSQKCLGIDWNFKNDTLQVPSISATARVVRTKRELLQAIAQFFDPLGLHSPVVTAAKILMQDVWKLSCDWDDYLSDDILSRWQSIAESMDAASDQVVPRSFGLNHLDTERYELHVFCDASKSAYGAAAYLRKIGDTHCTSDLIFCKTRVAPVKAITIPRLELLAAQLGVRIVEFIQRQLTVEFTRICVHSDSSCVLGWIRSKKKQSQFVENRLTEIRKNPAIEFFHTPTDLNPADLPSRGQSPCPGNVDLWWHGPTWLCELQGSPPSFPGEDPVRLTTPTPDEFAKCVTADETLIADVQPEYTPFGIDPSRFSSWSKLTRVTAWSARFIAKLQGRTTQSDTTLSATELQEATTLWLKYAQRQQYSDVLMALESGNKHDLVHKLDLFIDQKGILRCGGRLKHAELNIETRFPALLPHRGPLTALIVTHFHKMILHSGVSHTLSRIRREYWITQGRSTVKSILRKCHTCKRVEGYHYATPPFAPLPPECLNPSLAFTFCGVDYFGPMYTKEQSVSKKVWCVLYTCLVTRAVHLELVPTMSTVDFIDSFRRFVARRGLPERIWSDNAPQFKHADKSLTEAWRGMVKDPDLMNYMGEQGVDWRFIVEHAPWMGGCYERMVGIVKRSLRKSLGKQVLTSDQLYTVLTKVEAVVNTRPLVAHADEFRGVGGPLTPAHFLSLRSNLIFPSFLDTDVHDDPHFLVSSSKTYNTLWKRGQQCLESFWQCFQNDYLTSLRERPLSAPAKRSENAEPRVNSVVLIKESGMPRGTWRLGRVVDIYDSQDGWVRSATVQLASQKQVRRPVSHLYPVEVASDASQVSVTHEPATTHSDASVTPPARPRRAAAQKCQNMVRRLRDDDAL
ncbi:uncharacterized protein LOC135811921 [Sycon ciliatum]|uniref:uncharacterized protein LOC135811921 n=1 Tax=Sycon ciliatum TaxID=27933 RepID=UPI0031F6B1A4